MTRFALLLAAAFPLAAQASFGGGGSYMCRTWVCHYQGVGLFMGVLGVPLSSLIFLLVLGFIRHKERSQGRQMLLGAVAGIAAFELGALAGAYMAVGTVYSWNAFLWVYGGIAIASVAYARSKPLKPGSG